jgi:pyruvate dehydrogenase E2 component (dihydrolipoamide acetyltransferase)
MAETVTMPKLGFDMAEGTLVRWVKGEGDPVAKGEVLAEIETDKATVEVESNFSGVVARHLVDKGSVVPVGTPIAVITSPGEKLAESEPSTAVKEVPAVKLQIPAQPDAAASVPTALISSGPVMASPLARRMAQEEGVNLAELHGSGPGGRIVRRDIEATLSTRLSASKIPAQSETSISVPSVQPEVVPVKAGEDLVIPMDRLRAAIGRRMVEAKQQAPHFYVTHEFDMAAVMALRKQYNNFHAEDQKLSVNDFIVKAVALSLVQFPNLNASLEAGGIRRHAHINIGVAVAVEGGLLTVVCRDADQKNLVQISGEVRQMVSRARQAKVRPDDIQGSTFSISNLGMFDVEHFIAIINPPEAAILAVGSVKEIPVVVNGVVQAGMRMKATLSADHRVSDGVEAAQFLQTLAKYLEEPLKLLL